MIEPCNRICKRTVVEPQRGGANGGGPVLTPFGLTLVARYRMIERSVENAARKELRALSTEVGVLERP
jgi:molybdate transport system regulatory protein